MVKDMFKEVLLYYNVDAYLKNGGRLEAMAGCFPRSFAGGDYSGPFFDEQRLFYDNNLEGLLVKYRNDRIFAELGLDWMGMFDFAATDRRERFQVLLSGGWYVPVDAELPPEEVNAKLLPALIPFGLVSVFPGRTLEQAYLRAQAQAGK